MIFLQAFSVLAFGLQPLAFGLWPQPLSLRPLAESKSSPLRGQCRPIEHGLSIVRPLHFFFKSDIGVSGISFKVSSVLIASGSFLEDSTAWQFFKSLTIFIGVTKATSKQLIVFF